MKEKYFTLLYQKISEKGQIHGASFEKLGSSTYKEAENTRKNRRVLKDIALALTRQIAGLKLQNAGFRRSKIEQICDVIEVVREGEEKSTRIMYNTNMSWVPIMRLLENLVDQGLILAVNSRAVGRKRKVCKTFRITEKGCHILDYFSKSAEVVQAFRNSPGYLDSPTKEEVTKDE